MTPFHLTSPRLPVPHGFFTRQGGVSLGGYASLNCSLSGQDDPAHVRQNRDRCAAALGVHRDHLLGCRQVHGSGVVTVTAPWPYGAGQPADAMVTATPGLALGIITADCAPVLFSDNEARVIGAAHAGWRGAAHGVLEAVLAAMTALGADPARITAAIGPCIGQPGYEVGPDLHDAVLAITPNATTLFTPGRPDHWHFDLAGYCAHRLLAAGIRADPLGLDTCADEARFFSHRRRTLAGGGVLGHQLSAIRL